MLRCTHLSSNNHRWSLTNSQFNFKVIYIVQQFCSSRRQIGSQWVIAYVFFSRSFFYHPFSELFGLGLFHIKWILFDSNTPYMGFMFNCFVTLINEAHNIKIEIERKLSTTSCVYRWKKSPLHRHLEIKETHTHLCEYDYNQIDNQCLTDWPLIEPCLPFDRNTIENCLCTA